MVAVSPHSLFLYFQIHDKLVFLFYFGVYNPCIFLVDGLFRLLQSILNRVILFQVLNLLAVLVLFLLVFFVFYFKNGLYLLGLGVIPFFFLFVEVVESL
jgi:hypothetical protein